MTADKKKYFLIIDGNALVHRAWHALPPLSTKTGLIVSGAYGFTTILLGAIREFSPAYLAVTFDLKGPTFRHEEYAAYKAHREKKPDELYAQIPLIERILQAMEIPVYTAKGFEADVVIGTVSRLANEVDEDVESIVVTGDLDTLQLVDDRTKVYTLRKGITDTVLYDAAAVVERYGLNPDQMIDYKALRGDPSDNIPGVKGVGEKTAAELLKAFGSLDKLYASLKKGDKKSESVKPGVKEKLLAGREDALTARHLCTIRRDVPLDFSLERCTFKPVTREKVLPIFEEFQFNRLLAHIPEGKPAPVQAQLVPGPDATPNAGTADFIFVRDAKGISATLSALKGCRKLAFRTLALQADVLEAEIAALALCDGKKTYIINGDVFTAAKPRLREIFGSPDVLKVCHDLKREINVLDANGIVLYAPCFDLMIASYLMYSGERRHGLEAILSFHRNIPSASKEAMIPDLVNRLATQEIPHFLTLADEFSRELAKQGLDELNRGVEIPLAGVLARMERLGVAVDMGYFKKLAEELGKKEEELTRKIVKLAGEDFNVNSPRQLSRILFDKLQISVAGVKKTAKGGDLSTAAAELEKLRGAHPIIDAISTYRELAKLKSTYVDVLPTLVKEETGRIHASFNQTVTATGRLSSSDPNLQNIPTGETEYGKQVRNGFVAPDGCILLAADYSQIELRIAAHIANEKTMIEAFRKGEDIHWRTAVEMFGETEAADKRRLAKVINFGILYGMGPQRLAETTGITFVEAREYIDRYFAIHKGISAYIEDIQKKLRSDGYVQTLFGRRRYFRNFNLMNRREQAEAERQAINMPIQGTSADIIKVAMVRLDDLFREKHGDGPDAPVKMVLQVHDELIFEVNVNMAEETIGLIKPIMEGVRELSVPLAVNVSLGERWGELKKVV